jgi:hypothetical protein
MQGCGIVEYEEAPAALAAMQALHTKYHWTGGDTTMVVEWMDLARHRKDKQAQEEGMATLASGNAAELLLPVLLFTGCCFCCPLVEVCCADVFTAGLCPADCEVPACECLSHFVPMRCCSR